MVPTYILREKIVTQNRPFSIPSAIYKYIATFNAVTGLGYFQGGP